MSQRNDLVVRKRRIKTGPLPRVPQSAFSGPITLEARLLPGLIVAAVAVLLLVQGVLWLRPLG